MRKAGLLCVLVSGLAAAVCDRAVAADICGELHARLASLEMADRDQWEGKGSGGDPYALERERTVVLKALAANRCRSAEAKRNNRPNRIFAGLFGNKRPFRSGGLRERRPFGDGLFGKDLSQGTYRTLCVRTCDGYYFPISFSTSGHELRRDENACRALCPGQDVALYVQQDPGDEGGPMVSLAGEPYTSLSSAFRYRSEYDRACTCAPIDARTAAAFQAFAMPPPDREMALLGPDQAGLVMPSPPPRAREDDPDTLANRAGGFVVGPAEPQPMNEAVYREGPDGRVVRLVGPASSFLAE